MQRVGGGSVSLLSEQLSTPAHPKTPPTQKNFRGSFQPGLEAKPGADPRGEAQVVQRLQPVPRLVPSQVTVRASVWTIPFLPLGKGNQDGTPWDSRSDVWGPIVQPWWDSNSYKTASPPRPLGLPSSCLKE